MSDNCDLVLLDADRLDLLFGVALGLECRWTNLDPCCFAWARLNDLAFLRRLLLNDVIVGAGGRHQKADRRRCDSKFLQHHFPPLECTCLTIAAPRFSSGNLASPLVKHLSSGLRGAEKKGRNAALRMFGDRRPVKGMGGYASRRLYNVQVRLSFPAAGTALARLR